MKKTILCLVLSIGIVMTMLVPIKATESKVMLSFYTPSTQYKNSEYYKKVTNVTLTGNYAVDLVEVARSQVDYHEGNSSADFGGGNSNGSGNYNEYGYAFGNANGNWCAYFVSWCARATGIPESMIKTSGGASPNSLGVKMVPNDGKYKPQKGDLVFYRFVNDHAYTHVGIVGEDGGDNSFMVIAGNDVNKVNLYYIRYDKIFDAIHCDICGDSHQYEIEGFGVWYEQTTRSLNMEDVFTTYPEYLFFDKIGWSAPDTFIFNAYSSVLEQVDDAGAAFVYSLKNLTSILIRDVLHLKNQTTREKLLLESAKIFMAEYNQIALEYSEGIESILDDFKLMTDIIDWSKEINETELTNYLVETCEHLKKDQIDNIVKAVSDNQDKYLNELDNFSELINLSQIIVGYVELQEIQEYTLNELIDATDKEIQEALILLHQEINKNIGFYVLEQYSESIVASILESGLNALAPVSIANLLITISTDILYKGVEADELVICMSLSTFVSQLDGLLNKHRFAYMNGQAPSMDYQITYTAWLSATRATVELAKQLTKDDKLLTDLDISMELMKDMGYENYVNACLRTLNSDINNRDIIPNHICHFDGIGYEAAHPHKEYSYCNVVINNGWPNYYCNSTPERPYIGSNKYVSSCNQCIAKDKVDVTVGNCAECYITTQSGTLNCRTGPGAEYPLVKAGYGVGENKELIIVRKETGNDERIWGYGRGYNEALATYLEGWFCLDGYTEFLYSYVPNAVTVHFQMIDNMTVKLSWDSAPHATSYIVRCNNLIVAESTETEYWFRGDGDSIYNFTVEARNDNFAYNELYGCNTVSDVYIIELNDTEILGDINLDNTVDIRDAQRLFQYSMLPEIYPIDYSGNVDFNGDGMIDIRDAQRLFQYSMLPDIYPIS